MRIAAISFGKRNENQQKNTKASKYIAGAMTAATLASVPAKAQQIEINPYPYVQQTTSRIDFSKNYFVEVEQDNNVNKKDAQRAADAAEKKGHTSTIHPLTFRDRSNTLIKWNTVKEKFQLTAGDSVRKDGTIVEQQGKFTQLTTYNENVQVLKVAIVDENGNYRLEKEKEYDDRYRITKAIDYDNNGEPCRVLKLGYRKDGYECAEYNAAGNRLASWGAKYGNNGEVIEEYRNNADGTLNHKRIYEYNKNGKLSKETIESGKGHVMKELYYNKKDEE